MKKMFVAIVVGMLVALFGAYRCSEAAVVRAQSYVIEYDESSIYVINDASQNFEFNVLQKYGEYGSWHVAHYRQIPYNNQFVKVAIDDLPYKSYHIWNDACGAVYRSVWKIVYGYGFS